MGLKTMTDGPYHEILLEDFTSHGVTVPTGFRFDGATVPRFFWNIIPPFKQTKKASCVHDYLCSIAKTPEDRLEADRLFFTMLREGEVNVVRASIGYLGVRIGAMFGVGVRYKHWLKDFKSAVWVFNKEL